MYLLLLSLYLHPPTLALPEPLPPLSDLQRFPNAAAVERQLAFYSARHQWLNNIRGLHEQPAYNDWFVDAIADNDARREAWQALHMAQWWTRDDAAVIAAKEYWTGDCTPPRRMLYARQVLAQLRRMIGNDDFFAGRMPGAVAVDYWRRAD